MKYTKKLESDLNGLLLLVILMNVLQPGGDSDLAAWVYIGTQCILALTVIVSLALMVIRSIWK